jgi:predicted outer membrane repeat protein
MFSHSKSIVHIWAFIALTTSLLGNALTFTPAHAAGIVVNTDTDKDGLYMFDGLCGLREAITNANNDAATYPDCAAGSGTDTITFAANYTITLRNELPITSAIIIDGNGAANTILQANASPKVATYRVFDVSDTGNLALDSLTVRNGMCEGSCANSGFNGGGIFNGGSLTVSNSNISSNTTESTTFADEGGGGIFTRGSTTLTNVTFSSNSARKGGGIYVYGGNSTTLTNVTFSENPASFGGGMYNDSGSPTLTNVTFSGNSARLGGGIYNDGGNPTLTNVTFSGNLAFYVDSGLGGGMYIDSGNPTLTNVTFSGNSTNSKREGTGGAIYNNTGNPTLTNTIVANSGGSGDCVGSVNAASSNNLIEDSANACGLTNGASGNIIGSDPKLGSLADNGGFTQTIALQSGSPAINAGKDSSCPATDQRGISRPQGVHCDIGAFEVPAIHTTFTSSGSQDGWILESGENTNVGGTLSSMGATLSLGDNASRKQYRSILSFNTSSLPDNAVISSITLKLKYSSVTPLSTNPIALLGGIMVDVRNGFFGTSSGLELVDFQSAPALKTVGPFSPFLSGGTYTIALSSSTFAYVNKLTTNGGVTQIRLRFKQDDNNDSIANMLNLVSGNNATAAYRPALIIVYTTP